MIEIEIKINAKHYKTISYAEDIKICDIIADTKLTNESVLGCTSQNKYLDLQDILNTDCKINIITNNSNIGNSIYKNTAIFVLCKAFHKVFPDEELVIEHSIGEGVYAENIDYTFTMNDIIKLRDEFESIVNKAFPIEKVTFERNKAKEIADKMNRKDIKKNIRYDDMTFCLCEGYYDYFVGQIAYNTSTVEIFEINYHSPGLILRFPSKGALKFVGKAIIPNKIFSTHQEHDKWLNILKLHNVSALNEAVNNFDIKGLIQIEEALHEKKIVNFAQEISQKKDIKLILVSGPSSSGKTSFSRRLSIQLQVNEICPKIIGMDDYFLSRRLTPRKPNGDYDYESIDALDLELLNHDLNKLMNGEEIELPKYDFIVGEQKKSHKKIHLGENEVIIMEGIHGLNDKLTESIPFNHKLKLYVSALNNLNIDSHNRIPTTDSRLFRRIVRDNRYRGHTPEMTIEMWKSVREGEDKNIFPFQENADYVFNSSLSYELGVLKKYLKPLLKNISDYSTSYLEAQRLLGILEHFYNIQDEFVPSNSILREFVGGSIFDY